VAQLLPSSTDAGTIDRDFANTVFGGDFTARLNMNLREDKHWSYGARSNAAGAVGQRMWRASAPVKIDKAAESVAEIKREIAEFFGGTRLTTAEELARQQKGLTLSLPGAYETAGAVMATIGSNVLYGRPDDYVFKRKAEIEAITPAQVDVAAKTFDPNAITWVVVGDLSKTEAPIRALNLGEVTILDADGKPVAR
ncbi:MAG: insulinase family protein, partial [Luteimonas sp.]